MWETAEASWWESAGVQRQGSQVGICWDMSNRYYDQLPHYVSFTQTWGNKPGWGRYWKGQLSRRRRRFARLLCRCGEKVYRHAHGLYELESTVNWKLW